MRLGSRPARAALAAALLAAAAARVGAQSMNYALASNGATATSSGVGSWASQYGYPGGALDNDPSTFWSDDGLHDGTNVSAYGTATPVPPFWLRVRLAAPVRIGLVELVIDQDMTYAVQTSNSSNGPWATQATRACTGCQLGPSTGVATPVQKHPFTTPVTAQYVQIAITFSEAAGAGACGGCRAVGPGCAAVDFCSFATDITELGVFAPSAAGWAPPPPSPPPAAALSACAVPRPIWANFTQPGGYILRGSAALMLTNDVSVPGSGVALTRLGQSNSQGSVAINTTLSAADCACGAGGGGMVLSANMTSGGGNRGDGVLLALVDASMQTPGSTAFLTGCGLRAMRPTYALGFEFDTYDDTNDAGCTASTIDGPGIGFRLVRTYGPADPPVVLATILSTDAVNTPSCVPSCTLNPQLFSGNWWELQMVFPPTGGISIWVEGWLRTTFDHTYVPASFYVVSAGRTSTLSSDLNGVANVRVDCANQKTLIGLSGAPGFVPDYYGGHIYALSGAATASAAVVMMLAAATALLLV